MKIIKNSFCIFVFFLLLFTLVYPLLIYGIGQIFFKSAANGSLIIQNKEIIGSKLIGQNFKSDKYFHPRPSAAGDGYDATKSSGKKLASTSKKLIELVKENAQKYGKTNELLFELLIPADAVTFSASGLDPHISIENAFLQVQRIAKERQISDNRIYNIIQKHIEKSTFGILGSDRVNVLLLNLALDRETALK